MPEIIYLGLSVSMKINEYFVSIIKLLQNQYSCSPFSKLYIADFCLPLKLRSLKYAHWTESSRSSVQFSRSIVSDSLQPHESQHARPPCPSPTPGVHSDSRPLSQWCHRHSEFYIVATWFSKCGLRNPEGPRDFQGSARSKLFLYSYYDVVYFLSLDWRLHWWVRVLVCPQKSGQWSHVMPLGHHYVLTTAHTVRNKCQS